MLKKSNTDLYFYLLSVLDFTNLDSEATFSKMNLFFGKYSPYLQYVRAVCVFSKFLPIVNKYREKNEDTFSLCTVLNFPNGDSSLNAILKKTNLALNFGAKELDLVINYREYNKLGRSPTTTIFVPEVKRLLDNKSHILKIILEIGEINDPITKNIVISNILKFRPNFIKTSTGKNKLWSHDDILLCLKRLKKHNALLKKNEWTGFKISGGVSSIEKAEKYYHLVEELMGKEFIKMGLFRIGSSGLMNSVLAKNNIIIKKADIKTTY